MNVGMITLSFDDGRKDTYNVFKRILEPRNLSGVVYIPSKYIEIGFNDALEIGHNGLMSRTELDEIQRIDLFEVSGHGWMHKNDFDDIQKGINLLREWYPDQNEWGLASPHSEINASYVQNNEDKFRYMGFKYVRGGRNFEKKTKLKRAVSLLARITKSPTIFKYCYRNSVNDRESYYLHAIPIHKLTTLEQVKAIVDYCVEKKCWAILEFHGIDKLNSKEYTEEFCWLEDDFVKLTDYLLELKNKNKLLVLNPLDALKAINN